MGDLSYGIDHFLITIVPLEDAGLDGFQPPSGMSLMTDVWLQTQIRQRRSVQREILLDESYILYLLF